MDDALTVQVVMVMLVVDIVVYMLLVWYIQEVWPGRYGIAKPLYFPFQLSYWLGQRWSWENLLHYHRDRHTHSRVTMETIGIVIIISIGIECKTHLETQT